MWSKRCAGRFGQRSHCLGTRFPPSPLSRRPPQASFCRIRLYVSRSTRNNQEAQPHRSAGRAGAPSPLSEMGRTGWTARGTGVGMRQSESVGLTLSEKADRPVMRLEGFLDAGEKGGDGRLSFGPGDGRGGHTAGRCLSVEELSGHELDVLDRRWMELLRDSRLVSFVQEEWDVPVFLLKDSAFLQRLKERLKGADRETQELRSAVRACLLDCPLPPPTTAAVCSSSSSFSPQGSVSVQQQIEELLRRLRRKEGLDSSPPAPLPPLQHLQREGGEKEGRRIELQPESQSPIGSLLSSLVRKFGALLVASRSVLLSDYAEGIVAFKSLRGIADLRKPSEFFPAARRMAPRRIVLHCGPTNSGKTHAALRRLGDAASGVYLGPLRLLATEVFSRLQSEWRVKASLLTGQEKVLTQGAQHLACTVELAPLSHKFDVAVIDEVQMIADRERGPRWTRALLGLQAREVHLCGDPRAEPVLRFLATQCGDSIEVKEYERKSGLFLRRGALERGTEGGGELKKRDEREQKDGSVLSTHSPPASSPGFFFVSDAVLDQLRDGDCIVCFSRVEILSLKARLEKRGDFSVYVVYGSLPPEARRMQAEGFNRERKRRQRHRQKRSDDERSREKVSELSEVQDGKEEFEVSTESAEQETEFAEEKREGMQGKGSAEEEEKREGMQGKGSAEEEEKREGMQGKGSAEEEEKREGMQGKGSAEEEEKREGMQGKGSAEEEEKREGMQGKGSAEEEEKREGMQGKGSAEEKREGMQGKGSAEEEEEDDRPRILIASDAIGMGLNLNIRRIVFRSLQKFDGTRLRPLRSFEIRQVAGRAGRYGSVWPEGEVCVMREDDEDRLFGAFGMEACVKGNANTAQERAEAAHGTDALWENSPTLPCEGTGRERGGDRDGERASVIGREKETMGGSPQAVSVDSSDWSLLVPVPRESGRLGQAETHHDAELEVGRGRGGNEQAVEKKKNERLEERWVRNSPDFGMDLEGQKEGSRGASGEIDERAREIWRKTDLEEDEGPILSAAAFPEAEQLEAFAHELGALTMGEGEGGGGREEEIPFEDLLQRYTDVMAVGSGFFPADFSVLLRLAQALRDVRGMSVREKLTFCQAPADPQQLREVAALRTFAQYFQAFGRVPFRDPPGFSLETSASPAEEGEGGGDGRSQKAGVNIPTDAQGNAGPSSSPFVVAATVADVVVEGHSIPPSFSIDTEEDLAEAEAAYKVAELYLWLSHRFPERAFPDVRRVHGLKRRLGEAIAVAVSRPLERRDAGVMTPLPGPFEEGDLNLSLGPSDLRGPHLDLGLDVLSGQTVESLPSTVSDSASLVREGRQRRRRKQQQRATGLSAAGKDAAVAQDGHPSPHTVPLQPPNLQASYSPQPPWTDPATAASQAEREEGDAQTHLRSGALKHGSSQVSAPFNASSLPSASSLSSPVSPIPGLRETQRSSSLPVREETSTRR
uniref:RNA helicase n=1 Tax=Chromera velia CCMP2878 TaxID=1169474 RepID=A0A0G4HFK7_9ALVE|eukprot:Cvel_27055.t1-p1 / transcript=Cvel_27055.t1 / gene=Cvel_27055 / organism=Chromera_velia_CCMP2878 / gene_product=ATP-dependent RNA helicase SUV3, mitochondrial, putative / transcript_product=ATP-dependent RNA helicase SUV3, mitochondrial, putative / location=Cvel_scaffold3312:8016-15443(-) / protein_length=1452 / sequence_SO=supercontig / SO=protein_coding / is_pseudo=false